MLIASANSRSARGASHQLSFMDSCLTISHTCLPCLPSGRVSSCVPGVIEGSEDAWGFVNVCGVWASCWYMGLVTADWCCREVVEPRSGCKKS